MSFVLPFLTFLQPGILWPELAVARPVLIASVLALIVGLARKSTLKRSDAFGGKAFVYLVGFILAQVASVYYSGLSGVFEELAFWYVFPLFVVLSVLLMADATALGRYVWGMMIGSLFVVVYGIYAVGAWGGYEGTGRAGAYGMYDNHNDYSFIIVQILPFVFIYRGIEERFLRRTLLGLALLACLAGMAMSLSRGGMITLVFEGMLLILFAMKGRKRFWLLPLAAVLGLAAIGLQYQRRAENQTNYTAEDAESGRFELWKAGLTMLAHNPLLGVGSRRFPEYSNRYYELSHDMVGKVSHNTYVEIFSTSGVIGFFCFAWMIRHLLRLLRRRPSALAPPVIDATRRAALISLSAILLRAFLDAKLYDWSFYTLCAIGIACELLGRQYDSGTEKSPGLHDNLAHQQGRAAMPAVW